MCILSWKENYTKVLRAISDPTRRKILELIADEPLNPEALASKIHISRPGIEKHLKLLVKMSLAAREVDLFSAKLIYTATDHALSLIQNLDSLLGEFEIESTIFLRLRLERYEKDYLLGRITKQNWLKLKKEIEDQLSQQVQIDDESLF